MRCLRCKKNYSDKLLKCPFCHVDTLSNDEFYEQINLMETIEDKLYDTIEFKPTKMKKRDDSEVSLDKTVAIGINHDDTLIDQINKQIDEVNEEAINKGEIDKSLGNETDVITLTSLDSLKKRRKVLVITAVVSVFLTAILTCVIVFTKDLSNKSKIEVDFDQRLNDAITTYYKSGEIDDLIYLMEDVKKDYNKIEIIQTTTKDTCNNWVLRYIDEAAKSKKEFDDISYHYRELIDGLYRYALVRNKDVYIRALTENDYDSIILQLDGVYAQSLDFYEGLDWYNEKDYNKAYYMFSKIEENNVYYDKSRTYVDKIYANIVDLLNNDINKMEKDIDFLNNEEKLSRYITIEETILEYNNVYILNLSEYKEYQNVLSTYSKKVNEYTEVVYKK